MTMTTICFHNHTWLLGLLFVCSCNLLTPNKNQASQTTSSKPTIEKGLDLLDRMEIVDIIVGKGLIAQSGSQVEVHYTGFLENRTSFDGTKTRKGGKPFSFTLGEGTVIDGWEHGVRGMRVGGKRRIIVPPRLAYGKRGIPGVIPPNSKLVFEMELMSVQK